MGADFPILDRGERTSLMEPLTVPPTSRFYGELQELAFVLGQRAAQFRGRLRPVFHLPLLGLIRTTDCYYSNWIEGHIVHPGQLEARAHIAVQSWIDSEANATAAAWTSPEMIRDIHRRFCELLPDEQLWVENPTTQERARVEPGEFRRGDAAVGTHIAVSAGAVPRFLERFHEVYGRLGRPETVIAAAAVHHRFTWIHPFADGNGRVAQLLSHAMLLRALDSGALWSVARGGSKRQRL